MTIKQIENLLLKVQDNWRTCDSSGILAALKFEKSNAVSAGDEVEAKRIWILERICMIQTQFVKAFDLCREKKFYDGWCAFARVEGMLASLRRHHTICEDFALSFIEEFTAKFQSIFPYGVFISPEFVKMEKSCSICKAKISLRNHCGHRVGEVYGGEMCGRVIVRCEVAAFAIVENPVRKYSVMFTSDQTTGERRDDYNYTIIEYAVEALKSPFHGWTYVQTTARHPHEKYSHVGRNDRCPCGSKLKYKKCCLPTEGVLRPHFQFKFENDPPVGTKKFFYDY